MELEHAKQVVRSLARALSTQSNILLPRESRLRNADTVEALWLIVSNLDSESGTPQHFGSSPARAGQPWSVREDTFLQRAFCGGLSVDQLAKRHLRTEGAIRSRLEKLGLMKSEGTVATGDARSEEALARAEQAYLDQTEYLEIYAPDCGPDDSEYAWEVSRESEEVETGSEFAESYVEEPERDLGDVDWSDHGDDLDSRDWERIMGGPEDDDLERFEAGHMSYEEDRDE